MTATLIPSPTPSVQMPAKIRKRPRAPQPQPTRRSQRLRRILDLPPSPSDSDTVISPDTSPDRDVALRPAPDTLEDCVIRTVLTIRPSLSCNFLSAQSDVTPIVREVVVDWLMEVSSEYATRATTLSLSVNFMDRFLAKRVVSVANVQLVAIVCMWIACKIEETDPPSVADIVFICDRSYGARKMLEMEETVLNTLEYRLALPTHMSVVERIASQVGDEAIGNVVSFASYLALLDYATVWRSPGDLAMGIVLLAMWIAGVGAEGVDGVVGEVCGKGAVEVAVGLLRAWRRVAQCHRDGSSRWLFLRFKGMIEWVDGVDGKKMEEWLIFHWGCSL